MVVDLSTLSNSRPVGEKPFLIGAENPERVERELFLLSRETEYSDDYPKLNFTEWKVAKASLLEWLLDVKQDGRALDFSLIVRASSEDIEAAQQVLDAIAKAGEELRTFLQANFQLDDLIVAGTF